MDFFSNKCVENGGISLILTLSIEFDNVIIVGKID
jgi:hypothetical protein